MEKAKETMRDLVAYAEEVVRDERLRADIRSAAAHGAKATERIKRNLDAGGTTSRLADDRKLRSTLRAMVDDLDHARSRIGRKRHHRVRNLLLVVAAAAAAVSVVAKARHRLFGSPEVEGDAPDSA